MKHIWILHDKNYQLRIDRHNAFVGRDEVYSPFDAQKEVGPIVNALKTKGYRVESFPVDGLSAELRENLQKHQPNLVLNLCDVINGESARAKELPKLLDEMRIKYVGCNEKGFAQSQDKIWIKQQCIIQGLPTPKFQILNTADDLRMFNLNLEPPVILKLAYEHASLGISETAFCLNTQDVVKEAQRLFTHFKQPILIEEFVMGRECYISVLGYPPKTLPLMMVDYENKKIPQELMFKTFEQKWSGSEKKQGLTRFASYVQTKPIFAERQSPVAWQGGLDDIYEVALKAFKLAGLQDWGRVEFRIDRSEIPMIIDVTPNTYLGEGGLCWKAAEAGGYARYADFIDAILQAGIKR